MFSVIINCCFEFDPVSFIETYYFNHFNDEVIKLLNNRLNCIFTLDRYYFVDVMFKNICMDSFECFSKDECELFFEYQCDVGFFKNWDFIGCINDDGIENFINNNTFYSETNPISLTFEELIEIFEKNNFILDC
jgi:hypothetical protein